MASRISKLKSVCKKYLIEYSVALIIFVPALTFGYIKYNKLKNNIEYTKAIVIGNFTQIRRGYYFGYEFSVKGVRYKGRGQYNPKIDKIIVGDSVAIVYDKSDPDNNKTLRRYKKGWFY